ncbi:MAG TPA: serine/threonine-protein kinase, partial [Polyangiaceae bacterium]|nr:serine/threonine-protein kinase [Polyangiaceae bacterium]
AVAYYATRTGPEGRSPVVLKIILPSIVLTAGDTAWTIVRKEAVALGRLNERMPPCPFVVRLLDVGTLQYVGRGRPIPLPWLAIEYVHGGPYGVTLEERVQLCLERTGLAFDPERAARVLSHVTEGLREVHEAGIIHRDINPNNVLCCGLDQSELFKISDFGIARPIGMQATFGNSAIGTPGYVAPEQSTTGEGPVGFYSDVFSLGALAYFILTGEPYFRAKNLFEVISTAKSQARRSIRDAVGLAPELKDDADACAAIDEALAAATAADPKRRPQTSKAFATSIVPWLAGCPPTRRSPLPGLSTPRPRSSPEFRIVVRHPVGHDWVLSRIGWDADGHCLGASTRGIVYFDGTTWSDVPTQAVPGITRVNFATRVAAGRWLLGGEGGAVAEYSRAGVTRVLRGFDSGLTLLDASGDLSDLAALLVARPGMPPLVAGICGGRWLKPVQVAAASALLGLARVDDDRWLIGGRSAQGQGLVGLYSPTRWDVELLPGVEMRAFTSCASRPERGLAVAVGAAGHVLRIDNDRRSLVQLPGAPELSAVAIDLLGRVWAGSASELWFCESEGSAFRRVWHDPSWRAPFVSIFAELGLVFAATADGAVLECRAGTVTDAG